MPKDAFSKRSTSREGHRARLRRRFLLLGAEAFTPEEMLELLLTYSLPRCDTKAAARNLLERMGGIGGKSVSDFRKMRQVGENSAVLLALVAELGEFLQKTRVPHSRSFRTPEETCAWADSLPEREQVHPGELLALFLNKRGELLRTGKIPFFPIPDAARDLLQRGVLCGGLRLILLRSAARPPGPFIPEEDLQLIRILRENGAFLQLQLAQYLIRTGEGCFAAGLKDGKTIPLQAAED